MFVFFFWFMLIWMFIMVFADIFRRKDLSGAAKAGWIVLIVILPLFGILIYLIARPSIVHARECPRRRDRCRARPGTRAPTTSPKARGGARQFAAARSSTGRIRSSPHSSSSCEITSGGASRSVLSCVSLPGHPPRATARPNDEPVAPDR